MFHIEKLPRKNSRKYKKVLDLATVNDVIEYIDSNDLELLPTPYVFTHIPLSDGTILTQTFQGIICSPTELLKTLTAST